MGKIISAMISILLLVLADRAAAHWHRTHATDTDTGRNVAASQSGAYAVMADSQRAPLTRVADTNLITTDK